MTMVIAPIMMTITSATRRRIWAWVVILLARRTLVGSLRDSAWATTVAEMALTQLTHTQVRAALNRITSNKIA